MIGLVANDLYPLLIKVLEDPYECSWYKTISLPLDEMWDNSTYLELNFSRVLSE